MHLLIFCLVAGDQDSYELVWSTVIIILKHFNIHFSTGMAICMCVVTSCSLHSLIKVLSLPDRAVLKDAGSIEQLQFKVVQGLLLMLERQYPDQSGLMFGKIISVLAQSRNYAEDCHKFIVTNMFTGCYMERFHSVPILFELFSANVSP